MENEIFEWQDLHGIRAFLKPVNPQVAQCGIYHQGTEVLNLLLLPEGMFSLFAHGLKTQPEAGPIAAMARVVALHRNRCGLTDIDKTMAAELKRLRPASSPVAETDTLHHFILPSEGRIRKRSTSP